MKENLFIIRNFLYRFFVIGFIFSIIAQITFMSISGPALDDAIRILHLPPVYVQNLIISSLVYIRVFLLYFILTPALALHWTISKDKHLAQKINSPNPNKDFVI